MNSFLNFISLFFLSEIISLGNAIRITITNNCDYPVCPALSSSYVTKAGNFSLKEQEFASIELDANWSGQIWGRTNCSFSTAGKFACQTGDCGSGKVNCSGIHQMPRATTLVELSLGGAYGNMYGVSVNHGYNIPVVVMPEKVNAARCKATGCVYNVSSSCPAELKLGNACQNPCDKLTNCQPQGSNGNKSDSVMFEKECPRAYSYGVDYASTTFMCDGDPGLTVTFCPSNHSLIREFSTPLQSPPPAPAPAPAASLSPPLGPMPFTFMPPPNRNSRRGKKRGLPTSVLATIPTSVIAVSLVLILGIWIFMNKRKAMERQNADIDDIETMESLQFDIDIIKMATRNFSVDNKLGEGGFGEVYKGKLESGQEVAVKRLLQNSKQGVAEFKTEVVLVAKLQHKNLVKLLGFCATSKEKILVYEFLRNSSLDRFIFDPRRNTSLDWQTRLNIIIGIARGLLYLHEDSRLTIIHRDLKTSNILLDEAMNPKISDFGMAKLFEDDQTQGDTKRIVGTYGYMAPEYAITGHYSVKSDIFSFGVIMLEIISGQKNGFCGRIQFEETLLHRAWRLWNEENPLELVDQTLNDDFPKEDVTRCLHIGLLCIQEEVARRPRVRLILDALGSPSIRLLEPKRPNFFGTTVNPEDNHNPACIYTGSETITELYPRS